MVFIYTWIGLNGLIVHIFSISGIFVVIIIGIPILFGLVKNIR